MAANDLIWYLTGARWWGNVSSGLEFCYSNGLGKMYGDGNGYGYGDGQLYGSGATDTSVDVDGLGGDGGFLYIC
jgi:hypothetical protein